MIFSHLCPPVLLFSSLRDSLMFCDNLLPSTLRDSVKMFFFLPLCQLPFLPAAHPLLLRLWYEPMWQEGADFAEQRVRCLRPGPVGDRRKHRLLALPRGGRHPSPQPEHRDTHVPSLWPLEGLLLGWWVSVKSETHRLCGFIPHPSRQGISNFSQILLWHRALWLIWL